MPTISWSFAKRRGQIRPCLYGLVVCLDCLTPQEKKKIDEEPSLTDEDNRYYLSDEAIERRVLSMPTKQGAKEVGSCGRCGKPLIELNPIVKE